jgi:CDP-paratose 2-epimerase
VTLATRHPEWELVAFDNLHRRGSELNLPRLRDAGVRFAHGDVREQDDLFAVGEVDALIEASAEPSVLAGLDDGVEYLVRTNLVGAFHCLEVCRRQGAQLVFLSTSRVYIPWRRCATSRTRSRRPDSSWAPYNHSLAPFRSHGRIAHQERRS